MKRAIMILMYLSALAGVRAQADYPDGSPLVPGANFRIHPGNVSQSEVFLTRSPVDKNVMFIACNAIIFYPSFFISEGLYATTDGGKTWYGSDTCNGEPIGFHKGDPGIAIDKDGRFLLARMGRSPMIGLYSHYSTDNGLTWSAQKAISTDDLERAALTTDAFPTSPHYGRSYAAWVKFALAYPVMFSYTDNGAQSWSKPLQVNNPRSRSAGGDLAVGPNGELYLVWAGVKDATPFNEILVGFAASVNGGLQWQVTESAIPVNGITGVLENKNNIRVNGLPVVAVDTTNGPRRGWIYILTGQKNLAPAGTDPDIVMYRSADGGATWSGGIRVNQDAVSNGKTQYFANIHIDRFGAVNVIFYDDRNTTSDSTGVFLARSTDGGDTWKEYQISDHNFEPVPIGGIAQGYQGDVIDITSNDSTIWAAWMDNSTGVYQVWATSLRFSDINGVDDLGAGSPAILGQNSPNPFHAMTKISYRTFSTGRVSLKVFDIYGNEVATLFDETVAPGLHEALFMPSGRLADGVYFYRLTTGDRVITRKMIYYQGRN